MGKPRVKATWEEVKVRGWGGLATGRGHCKPGLGGVKTDRLRQIAEM